jgi:hypothetical protein
MKSMTVDEYSTAVANLVELALTNTSGGRVAAQVLLSAYNGDAFQLDLSSLCSLDRHNIVLAIAVIQGRYYTFKEPHSLILNGDQIFADLWNRWRNLHVEQRGKKLCPDCDGLGKRNSYAEDDLGEPCPRCAGQGRICFCDRG